jgi:outer membrane protein
MKKTFKFMGAAVLGAAVLFGANSCNSASKSAEQSAEQSTENAVLAPAGSIVYIDMTKLMAEYQMAIDLSKEVEAKLNELTKAFDNKKTAAEKEITRKQTSFQTKYNDFQDKVNKGHLTETAASVKYQELQQLEVEYNNFLAQKEQELAQEQAKVQNTANEEIFVMNNKVNDAINTFVQKYRVEKGYAMIIISQSDVPEDGATNLGTPVIAADASLDVTAEVVAGLNAEYNAAK